MSVRVTRSATSKSEAGTPRRKGTRSRSPGKKKTSSASGKRSKSRSRSRDSKDSSVQTSLSKVEEITTLLQSINEKELDEVLDSNPVAFGKFSAAMCEKVIWIPRCQNRSEEISIRKLVRDSSWYQQLHLLEGVGLPASKIKESVDSLLDGLKVTLVSKDGEMSITERHGWEREFVIGNQVVNSACVEYSHTSVADHMDILHDSDGKLLSLRSLRERIEMPHLPLGILMEIVLTAASGDGRYKSVHRMFPDSSPSDPSEQISWAHLMARKLVDAKDETPLVYGPLHEGDHPDDVKAAKKPWTLLKPGKTRMLFTCASTTALFIAGDYNMGIKSPKSD
jgi:hypothetical protein